MAEIFVTFSDFVLRFWSSSVRQSFINVFGLAVVLCDLLLISLGVTFMVLFSFAYALLVLL